MGEKEEKEEKCPGVREEKEYGRSPEVQLTGPKGERDRKRRKNGSAPKK